MSYRPGYRFKVSSTRYVDDNGKYKDLPARLYDNPWDHSVPPDKQWRYVIAVLDDGEEVEVIEYTNGAVKVRTGDTSPIAYAEGWLG